MLKIIHFNWIHKPTINIAEIKGAHSKNDEIKQCSGIELNEKLVLNELKTIDQKLRIETIEKFEEYQFKWKFANLSDHIDF